MTDRVITAHVPATLAKKVDEMANSLERSRGWIVKEALASWIAQEEERKQWTLDALAEVDEANVIDNDTVRMWAASLSSETPLPIPVATHPQRRPKRAARKR